MTEPFSLPRQARKPFGGNRAQVDDLTEMENRIMSALEDAVAAVQQAVVNATSRFTPGDASNLQAALDAERAKYDELVASESAEDVAQNQELANAKAQTDQLLSQMSTAAETLNQVAEQVNNLGQTVASAPDAGNTPDQPAAPVEVEPDEPAATDGTTDAPATDANAPSPTAADTGAATDGTTPDAGTTPTDAGTTPDQPADTASPGDNAAATGTDPTDVTNMRPNL